MPIPSYRLYRERSDESGDFWIHCETIPARTHLHDWEIAPHRHDAFFQMFLVTAGHGDMTGGDAVRRFAAPCALFIPPGAVHGFRFSRDVDGLVVTALADRLATVAAAERGVSALSTGTRVIAIGGDATVFAAMRRIHHELSGGAPASLLLVEALMTDAIISLARTGGEPDEADLGHGNGDAARLGALETMIAAHFREHRPVGFYAARLGISAPQLNRVARRVTGLSVQQLVARRLLDAARRELVFTPTPVGAIALGLGFQDPAYFNRFFRRQAGQTPGAYRLAERRRLAG